MPRRNNVRGRYQRSKRFKAAPLVPSPVVIVCPTGKYGFSKGIAEAKVEAYQGSNHKVKPTRAYPCDQCPGWHLTSLPAEVTS